MARQRVSLYFDQANQFSFFICLAKGVLSLASNTYPTLLFHFCSLHEGQAELENVDTDSSRHSLLQNWVQVRILIPPMNGADSRKLVITPKYRHQVFIKKLENIRRLKSRKLKLLCSCLLSRNCLSADYDLRPEAEGSLLIDLLLSRFVSLEEIVLECTSLVDLRFPSS